MTHAAGSAAAAKGALRRHLLTARRALSSEQLEAARDGVRRHVLERAAGSAHAGHVWQRVFAYEPLPGEPGSVALLEGLADRGASILVPITRPDLDLDWIRWPESTTLGVQAVATATILLVPALAVDRRGMRLGRGGGSYDRALLRVPDDVPVVALLHRGELFDEVPTEAWDRPVDAAVTPDGWLDIQSPLARHRPAVPH